MNAASVLGIWERSQIIPLIWLLQEFQWSRLLKDQLIYELNTITTVMRAPCLESLSACTRESSQATKELY